MVHITKSGYEASECLLVKIFISQEESGPIHIRLVCVWERAFCGTPYPEIPFEDFLASDRECPTQMNYATLFVKRLLEKTLLSRLVFSYFINELFIFSGSWYRPTREVLEVLLLSLLLPRR